MDSCSVCSLSGSSGTTSRSIAASAAIAIWAAPRVVNARPPRTLNAEAIPDTARAERGSARIELPSRARSHIRVPDRKSSRIRPPALHGWGPAEPDCAPPSCHRTFTRPRPPHRSRQPALRYEMHRHAVRQRCCHAIERRWHCTGTRADRPRDIKGHQVATKSGVPLVPVPEDMFHRDLRDEGGRRQGCLGRGAQDCTPGMFTLVEPGQKALIHYRPIIAHMCD